MQVSKLRMVKIHGRFLIYSKRLGKWFVNKAYDTDKFAPFRFYGTT